MERQEIMLNIEAESIKSEADTKILEAFQQMAELYPDDTIDIAWEAISQFKHDGYKIGRGGRHIYVIRESDDRRCILITNQ